MPDPRHAVFSTSHFSKREAAHAIHEILGGIGHAVITAPGNVRGAGYHGKEFYAAIDANELDRSTFVSFWGDPETLLSMYVGLQPHGTWTNIAVDCARCTPENLATASARAAFRGRDGQVERHLSFADIEAIVIAAVRAARTCACTFRARESSAPEHDPIPEVAEPSMYVSHVDHRNRTVAGEFVREDGALEVVFRESPDGALRAGSLVCRPVPDGHNYGDIMGDTVTRLGHLFWDRGTYVERSAS